jgi:hypothetical protein
MSVVVCSACRHSWDGAEAPHCPPCLAARWLVAPGLVVEKHNPDTYPTPSDHYRSVMTPDFIENRRSYLEYAAAHGTWYYQTFYETYSHYTCQPLGRSPGVGIPAGELEPDHPLDGLLIADAVVDPHVFAVDPILFLDRIEKGDFVPLAPCAEPGCDNRRQTSGARCALHLR